MTNVKLVKDRDLLDPNFSGYKLSLDNVAVTTRDIPANASPKHLHPSNDQYSFLHAKLYGEHNHLVGDPWTRTGSVYWLADNGQVWNLANDGNMSQLWSPSHPSSNQSYNFNLVFVSQKHAVLSDGSGRLDILVTGDRDSESLIWRSVFSDLVCGQDRPFVVVGGEVSNDHSSIEVVIQYVEESEKGFLNTLEWISFSLNGDNSYMMERVRRLVTKGGVNMVCVQDSRLAVSAQKPVKIVFDSMAGEDEVTDADMEAAEAEHKAEKPSFYWKQTEEDIELWCYVSPSLTKSAVSVDLREGVSLEVKINGVVLLFGHFQSKVESDSWTWTLGGGKLGVMMTKEVESLWTGSLWSNETEATPGQEITDTSEDTLLANMTTDTPVVTDDNIGSTFNSEQLEECDDCDDTDTIYWFGDMENRLEANMSGYQHLCSIMEEDSSAPALVNRHDVDGLVWRLTRDNLRHVATFPALGYVQASKTSRKFVSGSPTWNYSVICDNSRHLYIYRQPQSLAAETELRNRKSGQRIEKVAKQQVVTLESSGDILGLVSMSASIVVLTKDRLYTVQI